MLVPAVSVQSSPNSPCADSLTSSPFSHSGNAGSALPRNDTIASPVCTVVCSGEVKLSTRGVSSSPVLPDICRSSSSRASSCSRSAVSESIIPPCQLCILWQASHCSDSSSGRLQSSASPASAEEVCSV